MLVKLFPLGHILTKLSYKLDNTSYVKKRKYFVRNLNDHQIVAQEIGLPNSIQPFKLARIICGELESFSNNNIQSNKLFGFK